MCCGHLENAPYADGSCVLIEISSPVGPNAAERTGGAAAADRQPMRSLIATNAART